VCAGPDLGECAAVGSYRDARGGSGARQAGRLDVRFWLRRAARGISPPTSDVPPPASARKAFGLGASIDLLNPKTGLFYVAVLPQVIPHGMPVLRSTLLFAGVDSLVAAALFASVACAAAAFLTWLRLPGFVRGLDRTTGVCMVGLGIRTAIERA
jgi:threonine/homoserine/homoserine lactone efflux protein